jgi:hypothetical protein
MPTVADERAIFVVVLLLSVALAAMAWSIVSGGGVRVTVTCPTGQTIATVHRGSRTDVRCG